MEERSVWMEETVKDILTVVFSEEMFRESLAKVWQYLVCSQRHTLHVIHSMAILFLDILRIAYLN